MKHDIRKICFSLMLNDKIIVQRFFNVINYNYDAHNSMEFKEFIDDIILEFKEYIRDKSIDYMSENQDIIMIDPSIMETSMTDGDENFIFKITLNDMTICHRELNAKLYPPKARYTIDVRPYIKSWLGGMTDILSREDLTYTYLGLPTLV